MAFDIPLADQMRIALRYVKFKTNQKRLRSTDKVVAETIYGKVKGVKWQSVYGTDYYSFEGIPFAKPPIGKLRFKAPVEPDPWHGVRRCTHERSKPCQMNIILKQVQGKEDCLYLNVYTRQLQPKRPLPVLVWIYGGGFQMGEASRDLYSPDYFMMENVVLISISYRLGPLGFLCLNDESLDIAGNAGLKDQVMALRWVKQNCKFFGGDPENITIFGESAGGSSCHYMMLTEQARELFHKCVIMSGSALAPWANIPKKNWAYRLAKATGYKGEDNDQAVLEHLRNCKASAMCKVSEDLISLEERHERLMFSFGPVIEPYQTEHCVIPAAPLNMMRNCWGNNIPLLIGGNSFEGLLMFTEVRKYPELLNKLEAEHLAPADANLTDVQRKQYGEMLKQIYFGDRETSWKTILQYSDVFSYKYFWHGIHRTVLSRLHHATASTAPTYLYRFDFDSKHFNFMRIITCGRKVRGTCHADDLSYMFYNAGAKKLKHRTAEYKTIRRLISILVQFAECGDPNIPLTMTTALATSTDMDAGNGSGSGCNGGCKSNGNGAASNIAVDGDDIVVKDIDDIEINEGNCCNVPPHISTTTTTTIIAAGSNNETTSNCGAQNVARCWLPVSLEDKVFKCLNISDELEVIDLPEAEKLKLWDRMYPVELLY